MALQKLRTLSASQADLVVAIAADASALLMDIRSGADSVSPQELKARGDRRSHELIISRLRDEFPDDPILSEETKVGDDVGRLRAGASRVWIVDPLDGTREFAEPGRSDWAVHIALSVDGEPVFGVVCLPAQGILLRSDQPGPLAIGHTGQPGTLPIERSGHDELRLVVSRSRPDPRILKMAAKIGAEIVPWGSAGAKAARVLLGDCDAYAHDGGQYEWDSAAPVAVALGWGFWAGRLDGSPIRYNNPDPYMPDLLICRRESAELILGALD